MTFASWGLVVFGLLVVGVVGYAIKFRPPKVEKAPSEADLRYREWKEARAELLRGARWTLCWTNRRGVAAPRGLAEVGALRAEAMLMRLDATGRVREAGHSRRARASFPLVVAVYFAVFGLLARSGWMAFYSAINVVSAIAIFREPTTETNSRRRLTRALFANHALIDSDRHVDVGIARA